jgi:hypothetical protein
MGEGQSYLQNVCSIKQKSSKTKLPDLDTLSYYKKYNNHRSLELNYLGHVD